MEKRCLFCYQKLLQNEVDFHNECSKKIFNNTSPPLLNFNENNLSELAEQLIQKQMTLTGVQAKLSLTIKRSKNQEAQRFTIVGFLGGEYILKPASEEYPFLPEVEDLTMHLAEIARIQTVPHSLIRLDSGNLAYITRRIDRKAKNKLAMEDMCQLSEKLTEDKYKGSYEQIGKLIIKYSINPKLDLINFCEQVLFSFLTGNADMHLKNFSLINSDNKGHRLAPAYDMLATAIVNPADDEDLALTLNGAKKKLKRRDFEITFDNLKLDKKQQENIFSKMLNAKEEWLQFIDISFLNKEYRQKYKELLIARFERIDL